MNSAIKKMLLSALIASMQFGGLAHAQIAKKPTATVSRSETGATKAPLSIRSPDDWIIDDDVTYYTPVVDTVSRLLASASKAFEANDSKKAATEMRAVAEELKRQTTYANKEDWALVQADQKWLEVDKEQRIAAIKRMRASILNVSSSADAIESGKIKTKADMDKAINKATGADLERRWLVTNVDTWNPVTDEPQHHFTNASAAFAKKDYKVVAAEIRKATSYLRLEAARTTGEQKIVLNSSVGELDDLSAAIEKAELKDVAAHEKGGTIGLGTALEKGVTLDEKSMYKDFAKAEHSLAQAHRVNAADAMARADYNKANYELKAAAQSVESVAARIGKDTKITETAAAADARALGDKLVADLYATRDEIANGIDVLGRQIDELGRKL